MPKITQTRVGSIYLKEIEPRKWRASWTDPLTKRHKRRVLPAATFKQAEAQAKEINAAIAQGRGFAPRMRGTAGHTVNDAVFEAVKHSNANDRTRKDYLFKFNPFADYLNRNAQGIQAWSDVTEEILGNYLEHCRRQGIAFDTIRQRVYVLRMTSGYMTRTYPDLYRDVAKVIRLKRSGPRPEESEGGDAILNPTQLRSLLEWLRDNEPMLHVWGMLQGTGGFRVYEAAYLREQDIDFEKGEIRVTETPAHRPKNNHSYRRVPASPAILAALRAWIEGLTVRSPEGFLFSPRRGSSNETLERTYVSQLWTAALRRARRDGIDIPAGFTARKLRATFVTAIRSAGADFEALQKYIGHAPSSVLSAHYDRIDGSRLAPIAILAEDLFEARGAFGKSLPEVEKNVGQLH